MQPSPRMFQGGFHLSLWAPRAGWSISHAKNLRDAGKMTRASFRCCYQPLGWRLSGNWDPFSPILRWRHHQDAPIPTPLLPQRQHLKERAQPDNTSPVWVVTAKRVMLGICSSQSRFWTSLGMVGSQWQLPLTLFNATQWNVVTLLQTHRTPQQDLLCVVPSAVPL